MYKEVNEVINEALANYDLNYIIDNYEYYFRYIKKTINSILKLKNTPDEVLDTYREEFYKRITIKGIPLNDIKILHNIKTGDNIDLSKYPIVEIKIKVNNNDLILDVYNTGFKYIPVKKDYRSKKIDDALTELKKNERYDNLAREYLNHGTVPYLTQNEWKEVLTRCQRIMFTNVDANCKNNFSTKTTINFNELKDDFNESVTINR